MVRAYVSIGSNVARERNIALAVSMLGENFGQLELSSIYESEPVGFQGEHFYNVVAGFETRESPNALVTVFRAIECASGRTRESPKFGPRTLDLDLLLYGDLVCEQNGIKLPRDEIIRYAFVLRPLAELAGGLRHPVLARPMSALWAEFDHSGEATRRLDDDVEALRRKAIHACRSEPADSARGSS